MPTNFHNETVNVEADLIQKADFANLWTVADRSAGVLEATNAYIPHSSFQQIFQDAKSMIQAQNLNALIF